MERFLQYVWQHRLYHRLDFPVEAVEIIDPGIPNNDAGPDFFNAKIKLPGGVVLAGNIEIHTCASDWFAHGHQNDPAYDNVILHVVVRDDCPIPDRLSQEPIRTASMQINPNLQLQAEALLRFNTMPPCFSSLSKVEDPELHTWLDELLMERLRRKVDEFEMIRREVGGDRNEATYIYIARYFGFGINNDAFERIARRLPLRVLLKHRAQLPQIEALLFGMAGLLDGSETDEYRDLLRTEFRFLAHKFNLDPPAGLALKLHRIRPASFPHIRLAQLAALLHRNGLLFRQIIDFDCKSAPEEIFTFELPDYWQRHYCFGRETAKTQKNMPGAEAYRLLTANIVCPIRIAYGEHTRDERYITSALKLLRTMPAENNRILRTFARAGLRAKCMAESQALLQLDKNYCRVRRCFSCRVGYRFLQSAGMQ